MANCIYFSAERTCGYSKQLKVDLDKKQVVVGYCLANFKTQHKVKSVKEIESLKNDFISCGFTQVQDE